MDSLQDLAVAVRLLYLQNSPSWYLPAIAPHLLRWGKSPLAIVWFVYSHSPQLHTSYRSFPAPSLSTAYITMCKSFILFIVLIVHLPTSLSVPRGRGFFVLFCSLPHLSQCVVHNGQNKERIEFLMKFLKCQWSSSRTSVIIVCLHLIRMLFFNLKKGTSLRFQRDWLLQIVGAIFILSCKHRLPRERHSPRFPALIHRSARIPPPSPSQDPQRQEADQTWQANLPRRGTSHSSAKRGWSERRWRARWGIPHCAC